MSIMIDERVAGGRPTKPVKVELDTTPLKRFTATLATFLLR